MERISFGKSWFRAMKRLTELWDIQKAKTAHEQRRPYVAVMENSGGNHSFIEVNNDYFGIGFLDSYLREFLSYGCKVNRYVSIIHILNSVKDFLVL